MGASWALPGHCKGPTQGHSKEKKGGGVSLKEEDIRNQYPNMMSSVKIVNLFWVENFSNYLCANLVCRIMVLE